MVWVVLTAKGPYLGRRWRSFLGVVGSFLLQEVPTWGRQWRSFLGVVGSFLLREVPGDGGGPSVAVLVPWGCEERSGVGLSSGPFHGVVKSVVVLASVAVLSVWL